MTARQSTLIIIMMYFLATSSTSAVNQEVADDWKAYYQQVRRQVERGALEVSHEQVYNRQAAVTREDKTVLDVC